MVYIYPQVFLKNLDFFKKMSKSEIQAIYFDKFYPTGEPRWNSTLARKWLDEHDYIRIKPVDKTPNLLRYRLTDPKKYKRFTTEKTTKGIYFVLGWMD